MRDSRRSRSAWCASRPRGEGALGAATRSEKVPHHSICISIYTGSRLPKCGGSHMRSHGFAIAASILLPLASASAAPPFYTEMHILSGSGDLGTGVAAAGDVNDDGFVDVIVGAPQFLVSGSPQGAAFVYHGRPLG